MHCHFLIEYSETTVNHSWPYHDITRPFTLIYYVVDGYATYKINGQTYEFQPNHLYFFPSNQPISLINDKSPNFKIMYLHAILTIELDTFLEINVPKDKFLSDIIQLMRNNVNQIDTTYIRLLTELLVSYVSEKYTLINSSSICNNIKKYIQENYVEVYRNNDLSKIFNYSNSHILKIYKNNFNITPKQHALSFMLENIISRLKNHEPIYKIADSLKFSSPENFSKFFKQHLGVSPTHFLKVKIQGTNNETDS